MITIKSESAEQNGVAVRSSAGLADEWTSYQPTRAREKTFYDIKLRSGEVVECCYPNGNSWYPMHPNKRSGHTRLADYRVLEIRKCQHPMDIADESSANDRDQRRGHAAAEARKTEQP